MKVELKLFASLMRYMPEPKKSGSQMVDVEQGTTLGKLLDSLAVPPNAVKLIFLNGIHARPDQVLKDGDRIGIFPPVAGG